MSITSEERNKMDKQSKGWNEVELREYIRLQGVQIQDLIQRVEALERRISLVRMDLH